MSKSTAQTKQFLVTGQAEFYVYIDAATPEEAVEQAKKSKNWNRTMNWPIQDIAAKPST